MMKTVSLLIMAFICSMALSAQVLRTTVAQGEIEGEQQDGYVLYKAIPYAEAPVGNLRWKMPVPKAPWKGVYKAEKWGARPHQPVDPNQNGNDIPCSEDCLYLSVQTPAKTSAERLPVFVMIHGGAFATGSYSGTQESFVREGIVYVNIEYRLGALGFMVHPELVKESPKGIAGNYGIYDQICALNWVHDNIAAFGGDPEKVTICGESAGGISVSILCASPLCKGLFRGAISESGSCFTPVTDKGSMVGAMKTIDMVKGVGSAFQKKMKAKNLKQLRKVDAQALVDNTTQENFWPVVDGYGIVGDIYRQYENGEYNDVDVLIGYNSDEGSLFIHNMQLEGYRAAIKGTYSEWADKIFDAYPATNDQEALYAMQDIFRDLAFGWGTWAWANLQTKTGKGKVYMYYFDQQSQNSIIKQGRGATHVAEMPFIYGWNWGPMTDIDAHMAPIMTKYWINFIKNGDPNADDLPYWTTYRQGEATVMNMHNGFSLTKAPNQKKMDCLEEVFKSMR